MNVGTDRAVSLPESRSAAQLCTQEPRWGAHPPAPRLGEPSTGEAHLAVSFQEASFLPSPDPSEALLTLPSQPKSHRGGFSLSLTFSQVTSPSQVLTVAPSLPPQPDCHLHLHLRWADNPYVSGTVHTKDTAPGLIMGAGKRWPLRSGAITACRTLQFQG